MTPPKRGHPSGGGDMWLRPSYLAIGRLYLPPKRSYLIHHRPYMAATSSAVHFRPALRQPSTAAFNRAGSQLFQKSA